MSKYQWKEEGASHVLDFQKTNGVFTITVQPNMDFQGVVDKEFPWEMFAHYWSVEGKRHKVDMKWQQLLREEKLEDAKAKAVFCVQATFLNGLTKIEAFQGKALLRS